MDIDIKQQIKELLLKENITMTDLVTKINAMKTNEDNLTTVASLNNKLTRGTIKYSEILEIFDALNYDIILQKRHDSDNQSFKSSSSGYTTKSYSPGVSSTIRTTINDNNKRWYNPLTWLIPETEITVTHEMDVTQEQSLEMRLSSEMSINWEVSELINKLIEYFTSNYVIEDKISKIFKNYLDDDIFAVNTRLEKYCLPLLILLTKYPIEGEILPFLTYIRNIYASGGLSNLSDNELNNLATAVIYYNEHDFIEKKTRD